MRTSWAIFRRNAFDKIGLPLIFAAHGEAPRTNYVKFHVDKSSRYHYAECTWSGKITVSLASLWRKTSNCRQSYSLELIEIHGLHRMGNYQPDKNMETDEVKMLWDLNMHHYHVIETRRPNVVIVVKAKRENVCKIIDPLGIYSWPLGCIGSLRFREAHRWSEDNIARNCTYSEEDSISHKTRTEKAPSAIGSLFETSPWGRNALPWTECW